MASQAKNHERKVFGRIKGRPLSPSRKGALALLDTLGLNPQGENNLDPRDLFSSPKKEYWLEIGFGNGEHVAALMRRHPDYGFLAAEPFINGMSAFLKTVQDNHENVRVLMDDAMLLARALKDKSLDGIYILNPDPWPKKRHHKRRIVNAENLEIFARILKPGGKLVLTTDVAPLAEWMLTHTYNHPAFVWTAKAADDWRVSPTDWIPTRYEAKQANHSSKKMTYLFFQKIKS